MSPQRAWIDSTQTKECANGMRLKLSEQESTHVVRSLRYRRGDALILINGEGLVIDGKIESADSACSIVEVLRFRQTPKPIPEIIVAQSMPKGGTMDDLVRNICEAGASGIIPLESARCEVKLDADRTRTRMLRWHQQAAEACKQSSNPWCTDIHAPQAIKNWLERLPAKENGELRLLGSLQIGAEPVGNLNLQKAKKITWLIGPEGDFTSEEIDQAIGCGFIAVTLGPNVLRAENAALACVVITQALVAINQSGS
ncbi:MAG: 16S rRNA (uracil(1498)-N(3))-methyltransferase [Opitutales bacterium]|jgi:16S rRNA (uracil1498-N3)-methyltransferase|nr:16S rRNA (uracil(1498)-N(3))-methyltransferase [Opitutales bacterium]